MKKKYFSLSFPQTAKTSLISHSLNNLTRKVFSTIVRDCLVFARCLNNKIDQLHGDAKAEDPRINSRACSFSRSLIPAIHYILHQTSLLWNPKKCCSTLPMIWDADILGLSLCSGFFRLVFLPDETHAVASPHLPMATSKELFPGSLWAASHHRVQDAEPTKASRHHLGSSRCW